MMKLKHLRIAPALLLCVAACDANTLGSNTDPLAGGSYAGTLQNGVLISFNVTETPNRKLNGAGALRGATSGVFFSVSGTASVDSLKLTMVSMNGDTATFRAEFSTLNRLSIIGRFVSFGGYTENALRLTRDSVQRAF